MAKSRVTEKLLGAMGKTAKDAASNAWNKATRDVPRPDVFYNLGMGIGPTLRNTANAFKSDKQQDNESKKKIEQFSKDNVSGLKTLSTQISNLSNVMKDIRKISLMQLKLAQGGAGQRNRGFIYNRGAYNDIEDRMETRKPGPGASQNEKGNGISAIDGLAAGGLALLAAAYWKDIKKFLEDSGISDTVVQIAKDVSKTIATTAFDALKSAVTEGIPYLYRSIHSDLKKMFVDLAKGNYRDAAGSALDAATPLTTLGGAWWGLKKGKGLWGKLGMGAFGAAVGYGAPQAAKDAIGTSPGTGPAGTSPGTGPAGTPQGIQPAGQMQGGPGESLGDGNVQGAGTSSILGGMADIASTATMGYGAWKFAKGKFGGSATAPPPASVPMERVKNARGIYHMVPKASAAATETATTVAKTGRTMTAVLELMSKIAGKIGWTRLSTMIAARVATGAAVGAVAGAWGGPVAIVTGLIGLGLTLYTIYDVLETIWNAVNKSEENVSQKPTVASTSVNVDNGSQNNNNQTGSAVAPGEQGNIPANANEPASGDYGLKSGGRMTKVSGMVLHHTGGDGVSGAINTLKARGLAYNYIIAKDGKVHQLLPEGEIAYHGGEMGMGLKNANTIGVAFAAKSNQDVTPEQVQAAVALNKKLAQKYGYSEKSVWGHGEVSPGRKQALEGMAGVDAIRGAGSKPMAASTQGTISTASGPSTTVDPASGTGKAQNGGADYSSLASSALGFDITKLGIDPSKDPALAAKFNEIRDLQAKFDSQPIIVNTGSDKSSSGPKQAPPAAQRPVEDARSPEKDYLWMFHNQNSPYYG